MSLHIFICPGLILTHVVYNSSSPIASTHDQLRKLDRSKSGAIVTKSCTLKPIYMKEIKGRYKFDPKTQTSYNRYGLINLGVDYFLSFIPENKPYILSFFATCQEDIKILAKKDLRYVNSIELNISCPNYIKSNIPEIIFTSSILSVPVGLKIGLAKNIDELYHISSLINKNSHIQYIVCGNTLPSPEGAIGGKKIKQLTLWNVKNLKQLVHIPIIGCGGIFSTQDVYQYLEAGAIAVQVGTCCYEEGVECFERIGSRL